MTVLIESYWREIHDGLVRYGIPVRHFLLHVDQEELERRIQTDAVLGPSPFRFQYVKPYAEAYESWLRDAAEVVDTTSMTVVEAAQRIAVAVDR